MTTPLNETDIAKAMASGELASPQRFANIWLFDLRITGTGVSYRKADEAFCFRDPAHYLNDEFVARCNGLPVILEHPACKALDTETFKEQVIGTIALPYLKGEEVWGIARIYDADASQMMAAEQLSTSPMVVCRTVASTEVEGSSLIIEGEPLVLDHVAIVKLGVWDKGGPPTGIKTDLTQPPEKEHDMADANVGGVQDTPKDTPKDEKVDKKADTVAAEVQPSMADVMAKLDSFATKVDSVCARMDSFEAGKKDDKPEEKVQQKADTAQAQPSKEIADMQAKVDALEAEFKKADAEDTEEAAKADAQAKADAVYQLFGESAPRALRGESLLAYRKRLASKYKSHSKAYADVDLSPIADLKLLDVIEGHIYADAQAAATSPASVPEGTLIERKRRDPTGRTISEFYGSVAAWTGDFKRPKMYLGGINA